MTVAKQLTVVGAESNPQILRRSQENKPMSPIDSRCCANPTTPLANIYAADVASLNLECTYEQSARKISGDFVLVCVALLVEFSMAAGYP